MNFSLLNRRVHLFLGLFLTPWILMYAVSTIVMHHRELFTGEHQRIDPGYKLITEEAYEPEIPADVSREDAANIILKDLGFEGAHSIRGEIDGGAFTILRNRPIGTHRITYDATSGLLRVERQEFAMVYALEMLHRRRGYQQDFIANDLWALAVDAFIVATVLWMVTGVWMWWQLARTRKIGAICLVSGCALFLLLLLKL